MYRRAHETDPNKIEPALGLAQTSSLIGDHETAVNIYRAILAIDAAYRGTRRELGQELIALKAPRKAIPDLEAALFKRRDAIVLNQLGISHDLIGEFEQAQDYFIAGLEIEPRDLVLRKNFGRSLALGRAYAAAIDVLRGVVSDPAAKIFITKSWR